MRPFTLFLLLSVLLPSSMLAQLTWTKHSYTVPSQAVRRADFNADGFPDLLLFDGTNLSILPNAGNGFFDTARIFSMKQSLGSPALLDFNRDGNIDVAGCSDQGLVILQGSGNGTLSLAKTIPGPCSAVASADFNNDGNPDIAVVVSAGFHSTTNNQVIIYFGDDSGGISNQVVNDNVNFTDADNNPCFLDGNAVAADFNGDKVADLALTADCPNGTASASALIVGRGDSAGHFAFHKDQELNFDAQMHLRLGDGNQDGRSDLIATAGGSGPHASSWGSLLLFTSRGDGTFAPYNLVIYASAYAGEGAYLEAATLVDLDGDGIKDGIAVISSVDFNGNQTFSLQFFKGQPDGSFKQTQSSSLASGAFDMLWGDFDKDGRADLVLARPFSTDVWLNQTASAPICSAQSSKRSVNLCTYQSPSGNVHFVGTPLDDHVINAMQIYVDNTLKFQTPDDLLDANLQLSAGPHRITAKAWDDEGPFSTTTTLLVCTNSTNRTVKICSPTQGAVINGPVHIVASADTSLPFSQLQVYLDSKIIFRSSSESVDFAPDMPAGTHNITVKGWDSSGAFSSTVGFFAGGTP